MQRQDGVNARSPEPWPAAHAGDGAGASGSVQQGPGTSLAPASRPRPAWVLGVWTGCVLLVGGAATAFAAASLWQLGTVVDGLVDVARSMQGNAAPVTLTPAAPMPTVRAADIESTPRVPPRSVGAAQAPRPASSTQGSTLLASAAPPQPFEQAAEASEKVVAIGAAPEPEYVRTECDDVFVYIVTIAEAAPMASAASLAVGKSSRARFKHPGQRIGDWEVLAITEDSVGVNPAVWLLKGNAICRAELAGNPTRVHVPLKRASKPPVVRRRRRARR